MGEPGPCDRDRRWQAVAIGAHRDITERRQAEELLRASEQSLSRSQVRLREHASRLFRAHEDE